MASSAMRSGPGQFLIEVMRPGWETAASKKAVAKVKVKKSAASRYASMRPEELAAATAEFDRELVVAESRPLTPEERQTWRKATQKVGRPRVGQGARVISVSVERTLLARSDDLARSLGLPRAALFTRALRAVLAAEGRL